jgi:hypothetical protein
LTTTEGRWEEEEEDFGKKWKGMCGGSGEATCMVERMEKEQGKGSAEMSN